MKWGMDVDVQLDRPLKLAVLGKLQINRDSHALVEQLPLKGQALLVYLMLNRQPYSRAALAGLLWGEMPDEVAKTNLRLTISRLRKVLGLGDYLLASRQSVSFNFERPHNLDAAEFEKASRPATLSATSLHHLLSLYRGDFLEDFYLPDAPAFESWVLAERERLRQIALGAYAHLIQVSRQSGQLGEGIALARRLLVLEPWHEEAHRALMWLLAADGQRSAALAQYETCRRLLHEELGVEPAAETIALYEQIRDDKVRGWQGDKVTPPHLAMYSSPTSSPLHLVTTSSPHNLPPSLTPFIGREAELGRLVARVLDPAYRLVTLVGEGGVGKTRLALTTAARLLEDAQAQERFPNGVWFVPLAGLSAETADANTLENEIAAAIGSALGITFVSAAEPKTQLLSYLRHKRCLLLLDNFEEFTAAGQLVLDLLANSDVTIVVTSREPLYFQAEYLLRLEGLAVPDEDEGETAVAYDSVKLFLERAERAMGRPLATASLPPVVAICRLVAGLPLAIELAASWTRYLGVAEILTTLQSDDQLLATRMPDIPARHRSLRAVFENSWRLLSADEQAALAQLSVFHGRFRLEAATTVTQAKAPLLLALVDKSLVQQAADGYWRIHDLLCRLAAEKRAEMGIDLQALQARHAAYYTEFIARHAPLLIGRQPREALRSVQAERDNLLVAWRWAAARPHLDYLLQAAAGMATFWHYSGLFREGEQALGEAVQSVQAAAPEEAVAGPQRQRLLARLRCERAAMLYELSRFEEAAQAAEEAAAHSEVVESAELRALIHLRWGHAHWGQGQVDQAQGQFEQALALVRASDEPYPYLEGMILRNLAIVAWKYGDLAQARSLALDALQRHRQVGDIRNESRTNLLLGIIADNERRYDEAREIFESVLSLARETGDRQVESGAYAELGLIASHQGEMDQAIASFEQNLRLVRETGSIWNEGVTLDNLGDAKLRLGDFAGAQAAYEQSLRLAQQANMPVLECNILSFMGLLACYTGECRRGIDYSRRALELAREMNLPRETGYASLFLGFNLANSGIAAEAEAAFRAAVSAWESLGIPSRAMEAKAGLAKLALEEDELDTAATRTEEIIHFLQDNNLQEAIDPVQVYLIAYQVLSAVGDSRATQILEEGGRLLDERAARIQEPAMRYSFLHNIPSHRELRRALVSGRL